MRNVRWIAATVWLAACGSQVASATDACAVISSAKDTMIRLPFSVVDGRIYVEAHVDGRGPFRFAVDTGASGMGRLDASMLGTLGLKPSGRAETSDAVKTAEVETTRVRSLSLGALERKDVDLITRDYKKHVTGDAAFDGILGRDFFSDGLLVVDYGKHQISFSKATRLSRGDVGALSYDRAFRVPIKIDGRPFEANIDTGANVAMVVPQRLWPQVSSSPLEKAPDSQLTNTRIETAKGTVPGPVELGSLTLNDVAAKVSERFPEILIGAHALASSRLGIDQRTQTLAVCP